MARGKGGLRHIEERLYDIVSQAKALNFKIIVGHPAVASNEFQRIEPPLRPGEKPQLQFYVGQKAWDSFFLAYNLLGKPHSIIEGVNVEQYTPEQQEGPDGASPGGKGAVQ